MSKKVKSPKGYKKDDSDLTYYKSPKGREYYKNDLWASYEDRKPNRVFEPGDRVIIARGREYDGTHVLEGKTGTIIDDNYIGTYHQFTIEFDVPLDDTWKTDTWLVGEDVLDFYEGSKPDPTYVPKEDHRLDGFFEDAEVGKDLEPLNEITAEQIIQKSKNEDPERVRRSDKVKTTYLGMSKFGILNFKTTSQSRSGYHYQTVEFKDMKFFEDIIKSGKEIMPLDIKKAVKEQDINVWCTDESFTYWAWGHLAYKNDFLYIDGRVPDLKTRIQAPKINNVRLNGGSCKHIISVLKYMLKPFVLLAISNDMNAYLSGSGKDKYAQQPEEVKKETDQIAQWDWTNIEDFVGLDKVQILKDLSKTIQVVPSVDKGDVLTDIVGEALPNEDQGIKRQVVDRIEDLIDQEEE